MAESPDIVARITQNINAFQYSKVHITGPLEVVTPAARVGDIINHTSFWSALAGAVVGAIVTAGIFAIAAAGVAAVGITGGLAGPIVAVAVGALATFALSGGISQISGAVAKYVDEAIGGDPSGPIIKGSADVYVNGKPLAMADFAESVGCTRHSPPPKIAQGSETVSVNNKPVARKGDKTECSATIAEGSPNVFIGSGQATYVEMKSEFTAFQRALLFAVEFVIPPTAIFGKGLAKALAKAGKTLVTKGPRASAAIAARMAGRAAKGLATGAARKAQNVAKAARAVGRGAAKGARAVGRGAAKGARAVGSGLRNGVSKAGNFAKDRIDSAKAALEQGKYGEALKRLVMGDPIDVLTGQVVEQRTDFILGQTLPLNFTRTWSRHKAEHLPDGLCGKYWVDNFSESLEITESGRLIRIVIGEGGELVFSWYTSCRQSLNPLYPQYTLIRHREYFELYNRDSRISKLFYVIETPELDDSEAESELTYPPLTDGRYLISAWLDTFDNAVQFHYNAQSWLESVSHTDGIILTLTYQGDWLHQITRVDNGQQQVLVTYSQDEHGHLTESDALLDYHLFYRYNRQSNLTRWADNDKTWVDYHYDEQGRVVHSVGADGFYPVWFEYGEAQTRVRDGKGNVTVYDYDSHLMKPLVITSPSGAKTHFEYDRYGNLLTQTFADGSQVSFDYLEQTGLVTGFTDLSGEQWHYRYNQDEQLIRIEDPLGRIWTASEHKTDSHTTALFTAPDGSQTEFIRNEYGLLTQINRKNHGETDRLQTAFYRYDPRHRLIESQDAEQRRIQLSYNAEDQVNQLKTANGHFW
uniref:PAAR domain-containing protein n=1 Tax=Glaesserella sp. TaxID=2094731 RepID=UPI00359F21DE